MKNKVYVITGCSSGIGKALTEKLLSSDNIVCGISRDISKAEKLFQNDHFYHFEFDLLKIEQIKELSQMINEKVGEINGLIHSAGVEMTIPLHMIKYEKYLEMFKLNSFVAFELIKYFSKKKFYKIDNASYILISSLATMVGAQGKAIYAASKGALEGYLKSAAKELLKKGIRLNAVSPGIIKTPMNESFFSKLDEKQMSDLEQSYPLGLGKVEYVVNIIKFLLSEESKWMTGQNIILDGGNLIS